MKTLGETAKAIRSKNAGPFWVTIDIFLADTSIFNAVAKGLSNSAVADVLQVDGADLKRFDLPDIYVVKFSFPRSIVQGSRFDRDMHGAQYANLVTGIKLD